MALHRLLLLLLFYNNCLFSSLSQEVSNFSLDITSFSFTNLTLLGDSYLRNGEVGLTRELEVPSSSSGSVICTTPIPFFDPNSNASASFFTRFTFSINNINPAGPSASYGDGLTFFLSSDPRTLGSPGAYLGLVNSSQIGKNKFLAVEFDTRMDSLFDDINGNHIGLDVDSLVSVKSADVSSRGIDLKSGKSITAWIDYDNIRKTFKVWMNYSYSSPKTANSTALPDTPAAISIDDIDLSKHYKNVMYVGFSASTEGSTERHFIKDWAFRTSGLQSLKHRVPDNSVVTPPLSSSLIPVIPIPTNDSTGGNSNKKRKIGIGLGIALPVIFFCLVLLAIIFYWTYAKTPKLKTTIGGERRSFLKPEILLVKSPREFQYKELKTATKGFHSSRILGTGSFGTVYKAIFPQSGTVFAVKRSKHTHQAAGKSEFISELSIIACLRHKNLVQLQGWCTEKGELLLVYEFMSNGSLDKVLHQQDEVLPWAHRYNIALGIASVLTYLHQECEQQVIHRDIKTSNIMLDGNYNARLGDFGLARLMEHNGNSSPVSTLTAGTMGYLAPEYLQCGKATEKTDVFSFGVVLLEVASGKSPIIETAANYSRYEKKTVNLVDWVWGLYARGNLIDAADKRLNGEFPAEGMVKLLLVGLSCANPSSTDRPSMRKVLQILNNEAEPLSVPKTKPSLIFSSSLRSIEDIVSDCEE